MSAFRYTKRTLVREIFLILFALIWLIPFYLLINLSLKPTGGDVYASPFKPTPKLSFGNYNTAWQGTASGSLGQGFVNSIVITAISVIGIIVLSSIAAYVLARRMGTAFAIVFGVFGLGLILPVQLGIIPLFSELEKAGLVGNYAGIILYYIGTMMPLAVFMYIGFLRALPRQCEEAAQVDGASRFRIFISVVFPLLRPATGTIAILTGLIIWNDFFTPLILLSGSSHATLPVVVYSLVGGLGSQWNVIFAAITISVLPLIVVFLIGQRQMMRGFASVEPG
jgi:raffinose/stachyose/melibiose transport system permease protein